VSAQKEDFKSPISALIVYLNASLVLMRRVAKNAKEIG
jgi:hypothetical protein